jgi:ubiquinone/menaquinone biosynthesis C-methylase UbiE
MAENVLNIEPEESLSDEGYSESSNTSYVTSIASEIRRGIEENGRLYPAYGKNAYGLPVDDVEQERNDMQHCKFNLILSGRLYLAPISDTPHRILDLGTGTGIWAIDMADKFPSAEVIGTDVVAAQPSWVPPNCQFEIEDIENDWVYKKDSFDFIHGRELLLAIRDWDRLTKQCFNHLKPGGYLEYAGTYPRVGCDDNSLPPNTAFEATSTIFFKIAKAMGASAEAPALYKERMKNAGFVDVVETIFKVPSRPWPQDKRLKTIGAFEAANYSEGISSFFLRGYTTFLGGDRKEMEVMLAQARNEAQTLKMHAYVY